MSMKNDYEIPVSKNTVDKMMETLIQENERLSKENQELTEKLNSGSQDEVNKDNSSEIAAAIQKYLN